METILNTCQAALLFSLKTVFYTGSILLIIAFLRTVFLYAKTHLLKIFLKKSADPFPAIENLAKKHKLTGKIKIVLSAKPFAFCLGIRNPRIYLSTKLISLLDKEELEAIILHEKYHLLHKDNVIHLLSSFIRTLFIFFPFVSDMINNQQLKVEIAADSMTTSMLGTNAGVISALKKLLLYPGYQPEYVASFNHIQTLEKRIQTLKGKKLRGISTSMQSLLISTISVIIVLFAISTSLPEVGAHAHANKLSSCLTGTSCTHNCETEKSSAKLKSS